MSDGVLRRLDYYVAVDETRKRTGLTKAFAKLLAFKRREHTLVASELLSKRKASPVVLFFHVDRIDADDIRGERGVRPRATKADADTPAGALLFAHVSVRNKPVTKPPAALERRRQAGTTAETLFDFLGSLAEGSDVLVSVEAVLEFAYLKRNHPILAPPTVVDAHMLRLSGAEYRGAPSGEAGLQRVRWSERSGTTEVTVSYGYPWSADALDLAARWKKEEAQCLSYIGQVL